jgi:hypothetical protein
VESRIRQAEKYMTREKYTKQKTGFILAVLVYCGFDENEHNEIKKANELAKLKSKHGVTSTKNE